MAVALALSLLVELALSVGPRQARNGSCLASPGIPLVLEMENNPDQASHSVLLDFATKVKTASTGSAISA